MKAHPLFYYARRGHISYDLAHAGLYLARLFAQAHTVVLGSNAAMWRRAAAGGFGNSRNTGLTPSDPFMGKIYKIEQLGHLRETLTASQWQLLLRVCVDERAAGRRDLPALREALGILLKVLAP